MQQNYGGSSSSSSQHVLSSVPLVPMRFIICCFMPGGIAARVLGGVSKPPTHPTILEMVPLWLWGCFCNSASLHGINDWWLCVRCTAEGHPTQGSWSEGSGLHSLHCALDVQPHSVAWVQHALYLLWVCVEFETLMKARYGHHTLFLSLLGRS